MAEASFTGFLNTLLIILLVIIALRVFFRIAGPYLMRYLLGKVEQRINQQFTQAQQRPYQQTTEHKETTIDPSSSKTPQVKKQIGEYIDYEEI